MTIKVLFLLAFYKVWCNNISPSATQEKGTLNLSCSDAKFETCPCWSPLLLTHYCYIVVGREYHLWSYNFFSSRLVKWCYIYIIIYYILYTLCNMISVYIYIFVYTISYYDDIFHQQVIFVWTVLGVLFPLGLPRSSCLYQCHDGSTDRGETSQGRQDQVVPWRFVSKFSQFAPFKERHHFHQG